MAGTILAQVAKSQKPTVGFSAAFFKKNAPCRLFSAVRQKHRLQPARIQPLAGAGAGTPFY
jgi:hypothetical protein